MRHPFVTRTVNAKTTNDDRRIHIKHSWEKVLQDFLFWLVSFVGDVIVWKGKLKRNINLISFIVKGNRCAMPLSRIALESPAGAARGQVCLP